MSKVEEEWYELEYSHKGADDWFKVSSQADSKEQMQLVKKRYETSGLTAKFEYRIVKVTVTREVSPCVD